MNNKVPGRGENFLRGLFSVMGRAFSFRRKLSLSNQKKYAIIIHDNTKAEKRFNNRRMIAMNPRRVLLKLSGEALAGPNKTGFDEETVKEVARQVKISVMLVSR